MASREDIDAVCKAAAFVQLAIEDADTTRFVAHGQMERPPEGEACTMLICAKGGRMFEVRVSMWGARG